MGILPLEFLEGEDLENLNMTGDETFSIKGIEKELRAHQEMILEIKKDGLIREIKVLARLDTAIEVDYYKNGGILQYMLRQTLSKIK